MVKTEEKTAKRISKEKEEEFLGQRIRNFRKNLLISQKELANKLEITQSHLCRIENDIVIPSMKLLNKIADALRIHPSSFFLPSPKGESLYEKLPEDIKDFLTTQKNGMRFIQAVKNFMVSNMTLDDITKLVNVFRMTKEIEEKAR